MKRIDLLENGNRYSYDPTDHHSIIKAIGKFNSVYQGYDEENRIPVIIKKLNENLSQNPNAVEQFKKELYFNLSHPNIIQTIGYVFQHGSHYIIREFTEGTDLKALCASKKIKTSDCIQYCLDVLDALSALHHNGIIHCDIRPANIIIDKNTNAARLTDLGLAKKKSEFTGRSPFALIYSPPEQLLNKSYLVNESSDMYALGITLYELLTRKTPFFDPNPEFVMNLQLTQLLHGDKKIPRDLFNVIKKATNKYPFPLPPKYFSAEELTELISGAQKERYLTATEMKEVLLKIKEGIPTKVPFWKKIVR